MRCVRVFLMLILLAVLKTFRIGIDSYHYFSSIYTLEWANLQIRDRGKDNCMCFIILSHQPHILT